MLRGSSSHTRDDGEVEQEPLLGPINEPEGLVFDTAMKDEESVEVAPRGNGSSRPSLRVLDRRPSRSKSQDKLPDHTTAGKRTRHDNRGTAAVAPALRPPSHTGHSASAVGVITGRETRHTQEHIRHRPFHHSQQPQKGASLGSSSSSSSNVDSAGAGFNGNSNLRHSQQANLGVPIVDAEEHEQMATNGGPSQVRSQRHQSKFGDGCIFGGGDDDDGDDDDDDEPMLRDGHPDPKPKRWAATDWTRQLWREAATRRHLTHIERMTTSPFVKYRKHRRVPWKFILNILVVVMITTLYTVRNLQYSAFVNNTSDSLRHLLGNPLDESMLTGATPLYSSEEVVGHLKQSVCGYFGFNATAASSYVVDRSVHLSVSNNTHTMDYTLTPANPLGPLEDMLPPERAVFLQGVRSMKLLFDFYNEQREFRDKHLVMDVDFHWRCEGRYDFSVGGGRVHYVVRIASIIRHTSSPVLVIINSLIIFFALPSAILTIKALYKSVLAYRYAKKHLTKPRAHSSEFVWADMMFVDKLAFFNLWHVTSVVADICLIIGSALNFSRQLGYRDNEHDTMSPTELLQGVGVFFAWVSLIKYMEWNVELYMLILAVKASIGRVTRFILTVAPVYIAFMVMGVALFYDKSDLFGDFFKASATLFALLNGDSILLVFQELQRHANMGYAIAAQIYLYTFCVLGITTVLNVFVFIIESGYDAALNAVYGKDDELTVFIDHMRLKDILLAAHANDPNARHAVMATMEEMGEVDPDKWAQRSRSQTLKSARHSSMDPARAAAERLLRPPRSRSRSRTRSRSRSRHYHHHHHQQQRSRGLLSPSYPSSSSLSRDVVWQQIREHQREIDSLMTQLQQTE